MQMLSGDVMNPEKDATKKNEKRNNSEKCAKRMAQIKTRTRDESAIEEAVSVVVVVVVTVAARVKRATRIYYNQDTDTSTRQVRQSSTLSCGCSRVVRVKRSRETKSADDAVWRRCKRAESKWEQEKKRGGSGQRERPWAVIE